MPTKRGRRPTTSVGFRYIPPTPRAADAAGVDGEFAAWVRQRRQADMMRQMEGAGGPAGGTVPAGQPQIVPQPSTLTEAVTSAVGIAGLHREATKTALELVQDERDRRQEAEASVGTAADAARKDESDKWQHFTDLSDKFSARIEQLSAEQHAAALAAKDSEAGRIAAQMKADNDRTVAALGAEKERLERELAAEKARTAALAQRPTYESLVVDAIANPDDPKLETLRRVLVPDGQRQLSPEEKWRHGYVDERLQGLREERLMKRQRHLRFMGLSRNVDGLIQEGRAHLPRLLGGPRGVDRHGVGASFDEGNQGDEGAGDGA